MKRCTCPAAFGPRSQPKKASPPHRPDKGKEKEKEKEKPKKVGSERPAEQELAVALRADSKALPKEQKEVAKRSEDDDFWKGLEEEEQKGGEKKPGKMEQSENLVYSTSPRPLDQPP